MTDPLLINQSLLKTNIDALKEGVALINALQPGQYVKGFKPAFQSTIGAHFRHVVEHYRCFFKQMPDGVFCYDSRDREQTLECEADYTIHAINEIINQFADVSDQAFVQPYKIIDEQSPAPVETNLHRELLFLQSHTLHHYAIIAAMTRSFGVVPDQDFGVAIATRSHQKCSESETAGSGELAMENHFEKNRAEG